MNILTIDRQSAIIAALVEGCSIRSTERITDTHRDTVMRLGVRIGQGCKQLHDHLFRDLHVGVLELDEIWAYVGKKQVRTTMDDVAVKGDQYTFLALEADTKAILAYRVGKRDGDNTRAFIWDLREKVTEFTQINTDAFKPYESAIADAFGPHCHYGQIVKRVVGDPPINAARRYSPGQVVSVSKRAVSGFPVGFLTSTSFIERANLSLRMGQRRFTRLTSGFSKKLENHRAAVALFVAHYNLCRVHETLRVTPAITFGRLRI
jgi:IS1 family transposase